ncbi:MAG: cell division protein FtsL [Kangiellaceae bacterium]|nr:cell division protein FtsL [Kangiellaceae bacterium]
MNKTDKKYQKKLQLKSATPSLLKSLIKDVLVTNWLLSLLFICVVTSAMFQAITSHEARVALAKSEALREQRQQYEIEMQTLRLEITSLTEANRISSLAKKQLDMTEINTENERIITL